MPKWCESSSLPRTWRYTAYSCMHAYPCIARPWQVHVRSSAFTWFVLKPAVDVRARRLDDLVHVVVVRCRDDALDAVHSIESRLVDTLLNARCEWALAAVQSSLKHICGGFELSYELGHIDKILFNERER
mmetsp:Transcript_2216/g.8263  ORF Transcript_2216/g.8263 Transcript_2216/m.8263 type:complete len:130 (+) Transcript_2216:333-722(+)